MITPFRLILLLLLSFNMTATRLHSQLYQIPVEQIVNQAALIVEGKVLDRYAFWDNKKEHILTANRVEVFTALKDAAGRKDTLTVVTKGGVVGYDMETVSESVQFQVGDAGVFCLLPWQRYPIPLADAWECYGSAHGYFQTNATGVANPFHRFSTMEKLYEKVEALSKQKPVIIREQKPKQPAPQQKMLAVINSFTPTTISAGTNSVLTINGSGFGTTTGSVRFKNGDDGGATYMTADAADITSWSDTEIKIKAPSINASLKGAATGTIQVLTAANETVTSTSELTVTFSYTNVLYSGTKYSPKLSNDNGTGGLTFTLSTSICNTSDQDAINALGRSLKAWRCASGVHYVLSTTTSTSTAIAADGVNLVTYDDGVPLGAGVLAETTNRYTACLNSSVLYWRLTEVDLNIDGGVSWYFCDDESGISTAEYDFQTVLFHELGHGHQLAHLNNLSAVMHYSLSNGEVKRTLEQNELNGANYIMGLPANPCGAGAMTSAFSNCNTLSVPTDCDDAGGCTAALSLPVELLSFDGFAEKQGVRLVWETASETNNESFTVERSTDGLEFSPLAILPGAGNSYQLRSYVHLDANPLPGINYYRLRQADFDGKTEWSNVISVQMESNRKQLLASPNPLINNTLRLLYDAGQEEEATVEVFNPAGAVVLENRVVLAEGANELTLPLQGIAPGIYIARLTGRVGAGEVRFWVR
jgi:hypothetical protein